MIEGFLLNLYIIPIDENIVNEMFEKCKINKETIRYNIICNNHNHITTTYYLLLQQKIREGIKSVCDMRSEEFYKYLQNPANLLITYGYDFNKIL